MPSRILFNKKLSSHHMSVFLMLPSPYALIEKKLLPPWNRIRLWACIRRKEERLTWTCYSLFAAYTFTRFPSFSEKEFKTTFQAVKGSLRYLLSGKQKKYNDRRRKTVQQWNQQFMTEWLCHQRHQLWRHQLEINEINLDLMCRPLSCFVLSYRCVSIFNYIFVILHVFFITCYKILA